MSQPEDRRNLAVNLIVAAECWDCAGGEGLSYCLCFAFLEMFFDRLAGTCQDRSSIQLEIFRVNFMLHNYPVDLTLV